MATTSYGVNDALAVKAWSKSLAHEASKATAIAPLIGTGKNSIIMKKTELKKGKGDKVTCGLRSQLSQQNGVTEGSALEGNEESLTTYSDSLLINELRHAVRSKSEDSIDQQRVLFNLREEGKMALADWFADRMSMTFFIQACGYTAPTMAFEGVTLNLNSTHWGFNTPTAPSTNRVIRAGSQSNDQSLTSSDIFDLNLIDYAVEKAKTANPKITPLRIGGDKKYVMYLHPYQVTSLRTNTSTGQWLDIQKAAMTGGKVSGNPIYSGALGEYNGVILRESEHVTPGVHSTSSATQTSVRRAVLLGAGAVMFAPSMGGRDTTYKGREEEFDYGHELGQSVSTIWGWKKAVFNSEDWGVISVHTYAAAAA